MNAKGKTTSRSTWHLDEADDPADWKDSFSFLRGLDASLRCELCYNILTAPVAIKDCNHVFCSVCVRGAINQPDPYGKHCPKCMKKGVYDSSLVPQPIIENAAEAWKLARPELVKKQEQVQEEEGQAQMKSQPISSAETSRPLKRARAGNGSPDEEQVRHGRVTRSGSQRETRQVVQDCITIDSETDEDGVYLPDSSGSVPAKNSQTKQDPDKDYRSMQPTDLATCPMCTRKVTLAVLNQHLDKGCQSNDAASSPPAALSSAGKSSWFSKPIKASKSNNTSATRTKLARPNYNVMKEVDIRKMLSEFQLSKLGSKERLVERHRQWVTLYNANLDASEKVQKTDMQLRRELAEWDKGHEENQRKVKAMNEEAAKAYQEVNHDHFQDLIKAARETHSKNKSAHRQKLSQEVSNETQGSSSSFPADVSH